MARGFSLPCRLLGSGSIEATVGRFRGRFRGCGQKQFDVARCGARLLRQEYAYVLRPLHDRMPTREENRATRRWSVEGKGNPMSTPNKAGPQLVRRSREALSALALQFLLGMGANLMGSPEENSGVGASSRVSSSVCMRSSASGSSSWPCESGWLPGVMASPRALHFGPSSSSSSRSSPVSARCSRAASGCRS